MKMKRLAILAVAAFAFSGCDGSEVILGTTGGGGFTSLTGIFVGEFSNSAAPGQIGEATFQLTQTGSNVSGTLRTNTGREANVSGTLTGTRIDATWTWTDQCTGGASTVADVVLNGTRLTGSYTSNDCLGVTTGSYVVNRLQP